MSMENIRVSSVLSFDSAQEKDIISLVNALSSNHKLGQYLCALIRLSVDNPEMFFKSNGKNEINKSFKEMCNGSIYIDRKDFFKDCNDRVDEMKTKVDRMYEMILEMYTLSLMGKHLGLEDKSKNALTANFIIEKQLAELQNIIGTSISSSMFASNKEQNTEKLAADILEFIINSYSDIVSEIKTVTQQTQYVQQNVQPVQQQNSVSQQSNSNNNDIIEVENEDDGDTIVDFGNADISALSTFFGD